MEYLIHILIISGLYIILTLSLNLIVGYTGLPAMGHAAFMCIGAYTSSLLALNFGVSPWLGLIVGASFASISLTSSMPIGQWCFLSQNRDFVWARQPASEASASSRATWGTRPARRASPEN